MNKAEKESYFEECKKGGRNLILIVPLAPVFNIREVLHRKLSDTSVSILGLTDACDAEKWLFESKIENACAREFSYPRFKELLDKEKQTTPLSFNLEIMS